MASSSDWIAAVRERALEEVSTSQSEPSWMAALREPGGFTEGAPFAGRPVAPQPAPDPPSIPDQHHETARDPIAEAHARGHAEGYAQGLAHARAEAAERAEQMRALRLNFRAFDQAASDAFARELADTVVALCEGALEGFAANPVTLLSRCEEAARRLGSVAGACKLHLNPEDIAALEPGSLDQWEVVADVTVPRAGLRFEGPDTVVSDGPDDWRRAIAAAIRS